MADDDDKPKKHTFESLYHVYCNHHMHTLDLDNEEYNTILLSQIDHWLDQAKLLRTTFSTTETGLTYMKFKKWRLSYEEFLDFLEMICQGKTLTAETLKPLLLEAGVPGTGVDIVVVK